MSAEQRKFKLTSRCPKCRKFTATVKLSRPDGTRYSTFTPIWSLDQQTLATCPRCGQSWNFFVSPQLPNFAVQEIIETARTEELIGDELRKVDNSGTSTSSVRRLRVSKRWLQKCDIQIEQATTATSGLKLKAFNDIAEYESTLEAAVKRNYAIGTEDEQTFEEEIELTVPPHTTVQLRLRWKRLWQQGYVVLTNKTDQINVPFRSVLGITFDQESVDA